MVAKLLIVCLVKVATHVHPKDWETSSKQELNTSANWEATVLQATTTSLFLVSMARSMTTIPRALTTPISATFIQARQALPSQSRTARYVLNTSIVHRAQATGMLILVLQVTFVLPEVVHQLSVHLVTTADS
jgi:hypothetical protein